MCVGGLLLLPIGTAGSLPVAVVLVLAPIVIGMGYGPITAGVVARAGAHRAADADGADVLDQADRRAGRRGARRRGAAGDGAGVRLADDVRRGRGRSAWSSPRSRRRRAPGSTPTGAATSGCRFRRPALAAEDRARPPRTASCCRSPGCVYAAMQMCLMSFLVVYLTEGLGYSLVAAGFALTSPISAVSSAASAGAPSPTSSLRRERCWR